jgi:mannose-1-phosphate guanylyltransferase
LPKQLLPLAHGRTLLELAFQRLEGLVPIAQRFVCAGDAHREIICRTLGDLPVGQFLGEPMGRDTANALGLCAAILHRCDPEAVMGVCTADHLIEPEDQFREIFARGFALAERYPNALVTFGIAPTFASTAYGYLQLGEPVDDARRVERFREKPDARSAEDFLQAGTARYLWNSGMFVWRAATLLDCLRRYEPAIYAGLLRIAEAWDGPSRQAVLAEVYPTLKKISVDFAVMEPASRDSAVRVLAVPMPLKWVDVGSWNAFGGICPRDEQGNALGPGRHLLLKTARTVVASSDPNHLIATLGCEDLIIIHTPDATLVCRADQAESIKELHRLAGERFGKEFL